MYSTILCATDGFEHSDRALGHAAEMAAQEGAELHVVHLVERIFGGRLSGQDVSLNEAEIEDKIQAQAAQITRDQRVRVSLHTAPVRAGRVGDRLARLADEIDADLLIVGTRGRSSLGGLIIGSATQRLMHMTTRPVLVLPLRDSARQGRSRSRELEHAA